MKRRNTPTKQAVLDVLSGTGRAMSQSDIEENIGLVADRATIYRILNSFCDDGIMHRVVAEDGKQYFALDVDNVEKKLPFNHFHFRCTQCDTIECLNEPVSFLAPNGYNVAHMNCVLTGICNTCA